MPHRLTQLLLMALLTTNCSNNILRAPSLEENKLYFSCTEKLPAIFHVLNENRTDMPEQLNQRVTSLLIAAEIDSQFKHYPTCADKLERAQLLLQQANIDISSIKVEHTLDTVKSD